MTTIMQETTTAATTDSEHACAITWDAETVRDMHEMIERTGHPCAGSVGGSCPVMPRALSTIAKQHADPRAVKVYAASAVVRHYADQVRAAEKAAKSTTTPEEISRVFSDALKAAGISQRRAAEQTGIPLSTLRRWLKDATPLLASELAVLADLLNTTVTSKAAKA